MPEDLGLFWLAKFPWDVDLTELPDNRSAVAAIMYMMEKRLLWNPEWREIYEVQLRDLVTRGYAVEIYAEDIENYDKLGGKTYYISHQMAVNMQSKITPV